MQFNIFGIPHGEWQQISISDEYTILSQESEKLCQTVYMAMNKSYLEANRNLTQLSENNREKVKKYINLNFLLDETKYLVEYIK